MTENRDPDDALRLLTPSDKEPKNDFLLSLCDQLGLPEKVADFADSLWTVFQRSGVPQIQSDYVGSYVCSVYIASVDTRLPYGLSDPEMTSGTLDPPCITISELLRISNYSIIQFMELFDVLKANVELSDAVKHHLLATKTKYLLSSPLYHKFESILVEIFQEDDLTFSPAGDKKDHSDRKYFIWTLFVYAKSRVQNTSELVFNFQLLLCCINYVLRMTPGFLLKPPFDELRLGSGENENDVEMLRELSNRYQANFESVRLVQLACLDPIIEILPQSQGSIDVDAMKTAYRVQHSNLGDIDELAFLAHVAYLQPPIRSEPNNNSSEAMDTTAPETVSRENQNGNSQVLTTMKSHEESMTPVRAAMSCVQKLHSLLLHIGSKGSDMLHGYFQQCAVNPELFISGLLNEAKPVFVKGYQTTMGKNRASIAEQRFNLAVKLYYRVMEALLRQEKGRLAEDHFSHLLHNAVSHKCLLACAVEVVMAAYNSNTLKMPAPQSPGASEDGAGSTMFPWILKVFSLQGFDFFIVLENFIHVETQLSPDIVKHLQAVENRLLESVAWKPGSPLFETLTYCEVTMNKPDNSNPQAISNVQSETSGQSVVVRGPSGSSINSPRLHRSHGLNRFLNKVCRLLYKRLQIMAYNLKISKEVELKIWTCMEHCIINCADLIRGRHLDQILMCCIYAICRVLDQEILFKTIVSVYKELPHASQQVYKAVLVSGDDYESIIVFYNRVFTQSLKNYILTFSKTGVNMSPRPGGASSPRTGSLTASPSYLIPGHKNFYVSPLRGAQLRSPSGGHVTPRTRQLISLSDSFGSEEKFRGINSWMKTQASARHVRVPNSKTPKRLAFEDMDETAMSSGVNDEPMMIGKRIKYNSDKPMPFTSSQPSRNPEQKC